jgi:hypothetical protein
MAPMMSGCERTIVIITLCLFSSTNASDDSHYWGKPYPPSGAVNSEVWPVPAPTAGYEQNRGRHDGYPAPYPTFPDTNGYSEWPTTSPTPRASKDPRNTHAPSVALTGNNKVYLFPTTTYDDIYVIRQFNKPTPTPTNIFTERTINLGIEIWSIAYAVEVVLLIVLWRCWAKCRTNADPFRRVSPDGVGTDFHRVQGNEELTMEEVTLYAKINTPPSPPLFNPYTLPMKAYCIFSAKQQQQTL